MISSKAQADIQIKLNDKIRLSESNFDSVSSYDAEIGLLERKLVEIAESQAKLENEIRESKYDERTREMVASIRQKEGERDKIQSELSVLNRQADSRAQLTIKRTELRSKQGQVEASSVVL